jgi:hypothetical protein
LEFRIINKINNSDGSSKNGWLQSTSQNANEDPLHFLVFMPSPLQNKGYPVLEVMQPWVAWHTMKMSINFCGTCDLNTPIHQMVLEYTLVQLVKNIQSEAREDVGVGKIGPEW